ncbi:hypothetical protein N9D90_00820 [Alphaproteobacteria bacterium]|nr:hypothetical protein [Alphaproteobacteria bacterium]
MNYDEYQGLLENVGIRSFLTKPYGLELLFILERCELENADNGVEDTHELLTQFKPRRGAFSTFIQDLCAGGYITKSTSGLKASKSVLRMSTDVRKAFKA